MNDINVVMIGLGYIGLPTAALIASKKINILGVDVKKNVVETINRGEIHIIEPDLDGIVKHVVSNGYLKAGTIPVSADVFLIAVPTPFKGNHEPDISFVEAATKSIIPFLKENNLFIIESTSPVGTTEKMAEIIYKNRPELKGKIYIAYCPERVLPGKVLYELENNDRVIGGIDEKSTDKAINFYSKFVKGKLHKTNSKTAEMCKLVENSYRDVNIAFANELSIICDKIGIKVNELIELANMHPRVKILKPGCGVGGHCIAVDPWFLVADFPNEAKIIHQARLINDYKSEWVIEKIKNVALEFELKNKRKPILACMGLAFKADIDDLRESPALYISKKVSNLGYEVFINEPNIENHNEFKLVNIELIIKKADIFVYLVGHKEYKEIKISKNKVILDFCGITNK